MIQLLLIGVPLLVGLMALTGRKASADDPDMYHALYRLNRWRS